jgi:hypothetical protein
MGIFGSIRDAIFGHAQAARPAAAPTAAPAGQGNSWLPIPEFPQASGQAATVGQSVDVDAVLREKMAAKGNPDLNYKSSIVDLMKLLDLDSSLAARGELAGELGYTGAKDGSAEMNIWLHRKVMEELLRHGDAVPETLKV